MFSESIDSIVPAFIQLPTYKGLLLSVCSDTLVGSAKHGTTRKDIQRIIVMIEPKNFLFIIKRLL